MNSPDRVPAESPNANAMRLVELPWQFEPPEFFEEEFNTTIDGSEVRFRSGLVVATSPLMEVDALRAKRRALEDYVENVFRGAQIFSTEQFTLAKSSVIERSGSPNDMPVCAANLT